MDQSLCGYRDEQQYQNADRIGLQDIEWEGPFKLYKNSKSRKAIFELMVYFTDCCRSKGKIDYLEANIMAIKSVESGNCQQYTHVIIDDCHELTKIQLDLIIKFYRPKLYSSITFLFEENSDYSLKSWLGQGRPFTTLGFDMTGRSKTLDIGQTDKHYENRQMNSRHNPDCNISYREIDEPEKILEFMMTLFKENMTNENFSLVFKNENISIELSKSRNLLMIRRNNE